MERARSAHRPHGRPAHRGGPAPGRGVVPRARSAALRPGAHEPARSRARDRTPRGVRRRDGGRRPRRMGLRRLRRAHERADSRARPGLDDLHRHGPRRRDRGSRWAPGPSGCSTASPAPTGRCCCSPTATSCASSPRSRSSSDRAGARFLLDPATISVIGSEHPSAGPVERARHPRLTRIRRAVRDVRPLCYTGQNSKGPRRRDDHDPRRSRRTGADRRARRALRRVARAGAARGRAPARGQADAPGLRPHDAPHR